jgi:hypothetical protein
MVLLFRRADSPYAAVDVGLKGLTPDSRYAVTFHDRDETIERSGRELMSPLRVVVDQAPGSALITYRPAP